MAPLLNDHFSYQTPENETVITKKIPRSEQTNKYPNWYSPDTGICRSVHASRGVPSDPFLDVVSFIFSFKHNGNSAIIDSSTGSSISYKEMFHMVKSMASGLQKFGISQGDVVLLVLPNSIFYPIILLGVLYLGAVVTTMFPQSSSSEIKKRINDCNVRLAFTITQKIKNFESLGIQAIGVPEITNFDLMQPMGFSYFHELISSGSDLKQRPVIRQEDTAALLFSSGTTGVSKGVMLTHRNFISTIELFVRFEASQYEYLPTENVYLAAIPMFHIYGLSIFVMGLLSLGSSVVIMSKFDVKEVVKAIDRFKVTHFPVVPPIMTAMARTAEKIGVHRFRSLKQVSCGAASLNKKTIDDFVKAFPHVDFIQGYGMTESTAIGTRGFNTKNARNYTSVGLLAPNTEAKVVDWVSGSFMPPGKTGELLLRGPGSMKGYLNNPEATMSTIDKENWLHTGDIVYFDRDGYLYVIDRLKEVIKYKGFQIAPTDLEAVVMTHPEVLDTAVTAAKDEECGEIPVAFVVKKPGSKLSQKDVIDYVAQQVAPYKKVRKVVFTESIPKSAAGKVLRRELGKHLPSKL
ncbi:4-coumarate--CoA ligase-like 6 [Benincasa hispida]|uniref:4-coumarate--CoA ligase-like 6 n=1 Tax=Benincasa hispida TaxID=102211 RepID=UPI0019020F8B|nr:4-coumarate--CoA ligase-like 6 [Benincasa hispida]